jgi:hypothetical protein
MSENSASPPPRLLRLKEAAEVLSVRPKWIRLHRRELGFVVEIGSGQLRVDAARMERWIERQRVR